MIGEGINVNVTLLFSQQVYEQVAEAYIAGLGQYAASGGDVSRVASVASFFISRIDTLVDSIATEKLKSTSDPKQQALLKSVMGKIAIANGKLTYQAYLKIFSGPRWEALAKRARRPSVFSGQVRARRIRSTATCCTWKN